MNELMETFVKFWLAIKFVDVIEFFGTIAFAISGIRLASAKNVDWFGAFVVGFVTATGGGTLRDILLGVTPFWMLTSVYIWCTIVALMLVIIFPQKLIRLNNTFLWFDSIGLGLFVVVGTEKP
ncbi:TRIC cation channel family protein [Myroides sp. mNGS23_01]|nr:TRIC cation channel family protein [Myroides sp. mNGS23_01]WHT40569.1 TRIC cation channel family protein [Myroides sp. mNGS23_01]